MDEKQSQLPQQPAKIPESEEEQKKVIKLLEESLEKHAENRRTVQGKLTEVVNRLTGQVDDLEERINKRLREEFSSEDDRLQRALNELRGNNTISAPQKAKAKLRTVQSYEIIENKEHNNDFTTLYELKTEMRTVHEDASVGFAVSETNSSTHNPSGATEMNETPCDSGKFAEERERLIELLEERIEEHDNNKKAAQDKLHEVCEGLRTRICELEDRIGKELEEKFTSEDDRLQAALNELRGNRTAGALQKAKAELLVGQLYEIIENKGVKLDLDLTTLYELKTERRIVPELMVMRKPTNVRVVGINRGRISIQFTCLNPDEERVLSDRTIVNPVRFKCLLFKKGNEQESNEYPLDKNESNDHFFTFTPDTLETKTPYGIRAKMVVGDRGSEWSDDISEFTTPEFKVCCAWKECPGDVDNEKKYSVDEKNPRIATKINNGGRCSIIGNTYIPFSTIASWSVKILESENNDGLDIFIGVASNDIDQNVDHKYSNGWYFRCYYSALYSGSPHNYEGNRYGLLKGGGQYVHTGDSVGVVVDTIKGELSFVLNGVNYGVAYEGIPLDRPLVPCVLLYRPRNSVELDTSEVKENIDSSIPVPSNISIKNITWDSITFTWDEVSDASFYQVEVDGSKSRHITTNTAIKKGLLPDTEHSFRVRTVRGSSVSKWSGVVKGRTLKAPEFSECVWKTCPDYVDEYRKYSVDENNPRIATKINSDQCTIIGNTSIPLNIVISWNIKILKTKNNGDDIYIGVAPFDINQNDNCNHFNYGWYFGCYYSRLYSGPPHNYSWPNKDYGPRKDYGRYVHTGDSVGVVMDTAKGELSFIVDGVNLGIAYEGIPFDKPLVPCVVLKNYRDSVELIA